MSGVNSINWARIICQIVYYFYAIFKIGKKNINFSVPTGNFGDIYAGYMAKKMGLPIDKLIVATNKNDILQRVIDTGEYKPDRVIPSLSPSMDIQVSSNFERLLFDILKGDDEKLNILMNDLNTKGFFKLDQELIKIIKKDFCAEKISDAETLDIIKKLNIESKFIVDPHTATAFGAVKKISNISETIILGTAHPYKFLETVKKATGVDIKAPSQLSNIVNKKERFDIIDNDIPKIKKHIIEKII
jgi:threonine synthase